MAAVARVFSINELLEEILAQLGVLELLKAKAVARSWKELIEESIRIKRIMFLAPKGPPLRPRVPLETRKKLRFRIVERMLERTTVIPLYDYPRLELNPAFAHPGPIACEIGASGVDPEGLYDYLAPARNDKLPVSYHTTMKKSFVRGTAKPPPPYREMFLTQPPVTAITVGYIFFNESIDARIVAEIYEPAGITLGAFEDTASRIRSQASAAHPSQGDFEIATASFAVRGQPLWQDWNSNED